MVTLPLWDWAFEQAEAPAVPLIEPLIKWSGSKRFALADLRQHIPDHSQYIEPFIGGGSMLTIRGCSNRVAGDMIPELIGIWKLAQAEPEAVKSAYLADWTAFQEQGSDYYYKVRERFNSTRDPMAFLFLTRTAYNGLIRFNAAGAFNAPCHFSRPGVHPSRFNKVVDFWHDCIQDVTFQVGDYRQTLAGADKDTFVFLDPPYVRTKAQYLSQGFDFPELCLELDRLNRLGAKWMLTLDADAVELGVIAPELYQDTFHTRPGNSAFSRLKKKTSYVTDTVFVNYAVK